MPKHILKFISKSAWLLVAGFLLLSSCSKFQKLIKKGKPEEKYKAALEYYKKKDYARAGILLEDCKPSLVGTDQQELAEFYFAYTKYYQGLYTEANHYFKRFAETFARSEKAEEATYMAAYSLFKDAPKSDLDQASSITAIQTLQEFINVYPQSEHATECEKLLIDLRKRLETKAYDKVKLYFKTKEYDLSRLKSTVIAIGNFQKDYPDSDYNEELAYLKVESGYEYAKFSFLSKQKERYNDVLTDYQYLVDKYPNSKYIKLGEKYFDSANKDLVTVAENLKKEAILKEEFDKEQKERQNLAKQKANEKEKSKAGKLGTGTGQN